MGLGGIAAGAEEPSLFVLLIPVLLTMFAAQLVSREEETLALAAWQRHLEQRIADMTGGEHLLMWETVYLGGAAGPFCYDDLRGKPADGHSGAWLCSCWGLEEPGARKQRDRDSDGDHPASVAEELLHERVSRPKIGSGNLNVWCRWLLCEPDGEGSLGNKCR